MNENFGFDFANYNIADDAFNYISKEFSTTPSSSVLSDILSNPSTTSVIHSTPINAHSLSHLNSLHSSLHSSANLSSPLNSSSSSVSSCASSTSSPSHHSPAPATSPSSLSMSSSSCISITSSIDFQKLKSEMQNNIVKAKTEQRSSSGDLKTSAPLNLSSFTICQSKMENSAGNLNSTNQNTNNNNNNNNNCSELSNTTANHHQQQHHSGSHEFTEEEKEGLQISPFLSSVSENYCDITEYLTLPQNQAAKKLQMRPSTFSKRWKEASRNRKWPWRNVRKIDKEITCILHNMPKNGTISEEVENHLTFLLKQRQEELKPVVIRIS